MKQILGLGAGIVVLGLTAGPARAQDAMQIFTAQKCKNCHSIAGTGNKKGPLDDVGSKLTPAQIKAWLTDPEGTAATTVPKPTRKPPMKKKPLSNAEVDALVTMLAGLKK